MSNAFVVRNQLGQYWGKKKAWVDGTKRKKVAVFKHEDEGLNQLVELSSKDIELRGEVAAVTLDERGIPQVEPSEHRILDQEELLQDSNEETSAQESEASAT